MATERVRRVRFGPYNRAEDTHTILHPESEDMMVLINSAQIPQNVKDYFQSTEGGKTVIPIPTNVGELIAKLAPVAFGDPTVFNVLEDTLKTYVDGKVQDIVIAMHKTTGVSVKAIFRGYNEDTTSNPHIITYPILPNSSATASASLSVEIGTKFGAVSDIDWSSTDGTTKLRHLYIGLNDLYNDQTRESFYDLMQNMEPATASRSAQINPVRLVDDLGASSIIEATQDSTTATVYLFGMDDINEGITQRVALTMRFRKPIFYWKYLTSEDNGIGDTSIEGPGGFIANGTQTEAMNDAGWILGNGHSTKFIDGDITKTEISYTLTGGTKGYLYLAVPYSPYYNDSVVSGAKFFTGTNSDDISVYPGFNLANRIYDNSSKFSGGWSVVHNNYLVTLSTGHVDRYVIYRTDNVISNVGSSTVATKKFTLSDFE